MSWIYFSVQIELCGHFIQAMTIHDGHRESPRNVMEIDTKNRKLSIVSEKDCIVDQVSVVFTCFREIKDDKIEVRSKKMYHDLQIIHLRSFRLCWMTSMIHRMMYDGYV